MTGDLDLWNSLDIQKIKNKNWITVYKIWTREDSYNVIWKIKNKWLENLFVLNPKDNDETTINNAIFILNNFPNSKLIMIFWDTKNNKNQLYFGSGFEKISYLIKKFLKDFWKIAHFTSFDNFRWFHVAKDWDINNIYNDDYYESYKFIKKRWNKEDFLVQLFFSKKFKNKISSSQYNDLSNRILSLWLFDPSIIYSKSELYILYDNLISSQKSKIDIILRQAEIIFQRPVNSKSTLNFLVRHKKNIPEIAKWKYFTWIYCDFDGTLFEDTLPWTPESQNPKINYNILDYLLKKQKQWSKITIMTWWDLDQRKQILLDNWVDFPIIHKTKLAWWIIENVIDNISNSKVFHTITKILAVNYIHVDQIN